MATFTESNAGRPDERPIIEGEPLSVLALKSAVYAAAVLMFIASFSTLAAQVTGALAAPVAVLMAQWGLRRRLRILGVSVIGASLIGLGTALSQLVLESPWLADGLLGGVSASGVLSLSDALFTGLTVGGIIFILRSLGSRYRALSMMEAAVVVAAVSYAFAGHRNQMIHQPRVLSDWAWSNGIDPQEILRALGIAISALALMVLLRVEREVKLAITVGWMIIAALIFYHFVGGSTPAIEVNTGLGLTTNEQKGKSDKDKDNKDGKGGGQGDSNNPYGGSSQQPPPDPVAVAVFREDYEPPGQIMYFRQQVLSHYDGNHLSPDATGQYDQDVIVEFPQAETLVAEPTQVPAFHVEVPTSMFLLVDHPQPFALTSSVKIEPLENPAPQRFVSAYQVTSLALSMPYTRLVGRRSVPESWTEAQRAHYLTTPDDPRYQALSDLIVRDIDPRYVGDDLVKALTIKRYLEQSGFYTRKETHKDTDDPTASFLFGSMRGYCVHFAHSAVHLFRSQGIAARVAVGYAVDMQLRGAGSAVLVMADRAHAWPEIYVDGVGWITFDIYPQQSDETPQRMVAPDLESLLGELARNDPTGGKGEPGAEPFQVPWGAMARWLAILLGALLALGYAVKIGRHLAATTGRADHRLIFAATLDRFSDLGLARRHGETRERYAERLAEVSPSLRTLTHLHLKLTLGGEGAREVEQELKRLSAAVRSEWAENVPAGRKVLGWLNPLGWWFTR